MFYCAKTTSFHRLHRVYINNINIYYAYCVFTCMENFKKTKTIATSEWVTNGKKIAIVRGQTRIASHTSFFFFFFCSIIPRSSIIHRLSNKPDTGFDDKFKLHLNTNTD